MYASANLRDGYHLLETRTCYPPATETPCSADHSDGRAETRPRAEFSVPDLENCLEMVIQGGVKIEMEGKALNFPSRRVAMVCYLGRNS